jgi:hypothetical protein
MLQALVLLINSLFMSNPTADPTMINATISAQMPGYTSTYDAATGSTIVSNPDGSIIVVDPDENN